MSSVNLGGLSCGSSFGIFEPVTFALGFDDVTTVRQAIQSGSGESLVSEHFGPILKRQVGCDDPQNSTCWLNRLD